MRITGLPGRSLHIPPLSQRFLSIPGLTGAKKLLLCRQYPPIPTYDMLMRQKSGETWQQKVFLGDTQRSTVVEVSATTYCSRGCRYYSKSRRAGPVRS
jgi:hypothetical protein